MADSTYKQYNSSLKFWCLFCNRKDIDPFNPTELDIVDCLTEKFKEGATYGTIGSLRAAIALICDNKFSESGILNRFNKGVFRLRPTTPRYETTWDPLEVFELVQDWYPLAKLDFLRLTKKLVILLALGSSFRCQSLALILLKDVIINKEGVRINISKLTKTSRPGSAQPSAFFPFFKDKPRLCIASTIIHYLEVTAPLRGEVVTLFISTQQPFKEVGSQTISRWIRSVLEEAGIDKKFKAHSTRHSSTSKALRKGLSMEVIKKAAGWSQGSKVFCNFYNRPIEENFATKVFQ